MNGAHHTTIPLKSSIPITVGVENRCMTEGLNDKEADKERQRWVEYIEYKNKTQEKCNYCTIYQCYQVFIKRM